jgi:hypothetical protein
LPTDSLGFEALKVSIQMDRDGVYSYYSRLKSILAIFGIQRFLLPHSLNKKKLVSKEIYKILQNHYTKYFFQTVESKSQGISGGRFNIYHLVKRNYTFEKYLLLKSYTLRKCITQIRVSAHPMPVEKMRQYNIPYHERLCSHCSSGLVGTEEHTIMYCDNKIIATLRNNFLLKICQISPQFQGLDDKCQFKYLLTCSDKEVTFYLGIFLTKLYKVLANRPEK